jgi:hypothetical protein
MTGLNTEVAYLQYDAVQLYTVGDIITTDDESPQRAYINIKSSYGVSPLTASFGVWANGSNYAVGQVITFNNIVYQLTTNGENVNQNPAIQTPAFYTRLGRALPVASYTAWVSGTNYAVGDAVSFGGVVYVLFADGETTNVNPSLQPTKWVSQPTLINASTFWSLQNIEVVGSWDSGMVYPVGTVIEYLGELYISKSDSPGSFSEPPTNTDYFDLFEAPSNWYKYLIAGYEDPLVRKMQGELFNVEWNSGRTYNVDARVEYNGIPFIAEKTNRGLFPVILLDEYDSGSAYSIGDVITYANGLYMAIENTAGGNTPPDYPSIYASLTPVSSNPPLDAWSSGTTYDLDDLVEYNGFMYYSVDNANTGNNPFNNPSWWALRNYDTWNPRTTYQDKAVVLYNGYFYQTEINNNTNNIPTSFANGTWTLLGSNILTWGSAAEYNTGDRVFYGGRVWEAIAFNINDVPTGNVEFWKLITLGGVWALDTAFLRTGLYGLTAEYDMTDFALDNNEVYLNFPYGVGGQPYNPAPKRLLNSILGFTWNGIFNPSQLTDIGTYDEAQLTTQQQPLLYNRLRPVPTYSTAQIVEEGLLGDDAGTASTSLVYTADSYANLVYSSIISIYADIVKASSVDTQGATKLLALTSMNCGNLGIAFWSNYLENPLLKVQGDIYSVFIEFRDEFGEPFVLPNSAVATLTFKLNY